MGNCNWYYQSNLDNGLLQISRPDITTEDDLADFEYILLLIIKQAKRQVENAKQKALEE